MKLLICATTLCLACAAVCAAEPTEKDAIALAERGVALMKVKGKEELVKRIHAKDPDFFQTDLTLDMRDMYTGVVLANPLNPTLAGKDSAGLGPYPRQVIELAQKSGKGWIEAPASGKADVKSAYVLRFDDVVLEASLFKK